MQPSDSSARVGQGGKLAGTSRVGAAVQWAWESKRLKDKSPSVPAHVAQCRMPADWFYARSTYVPCSSTAVTH